MLQIYSPLPLQFLLHRSPHSAGARRLIRYRKRSLHSEIPSTCSWWLLYSWKAADFVRNHGKPFLCFRRAASHLGKRILVWKAISSIIDNLLYLFLLLLISSMAERSFSFFHCSPPSHGLHLLFICIRGIIGIAAYFFHQAGFSNPSSLL